MNKEKIILIAAALVLVAVLAFLPRSVVNTKKQTETAEKPATTPKAETTEHKTNLDSQTLAKVVALKKQISGVSGTAKVPLLKNLMAIFAKANRLDSAAIYAEQIVAIQKTEEHILLAGDAYFQAFGFAMGQEKSELFAKKTREYYEMALKSNPHLLKAKTNMGMTYMNSETPMQGIGLLREVLDEDPNYVPALMNLGLLSMQSNQMDKAIDRFRQILKVDKQNTEAAFYLGIALVEKGEKGEAKKLLEQVQKQNPDPAIQQAVKETLENMK